MSIPLNKIQIIQAVVVKVLNQENCTDHYHSKMKNSEILTVAIYSALTKHGCYTTALDEFKTLSYFQYTLGLSRFGRRLKRLVDIMPVIITEISKLSYLLINTLIQFALFRETFIVDTKPIPICHNIRIGQCHLTKNHLQTEKVETKNGKFRRQTDDDYRGLVASKREYYYGFKLNLLTDILGVPHSHSLHPASIGDLQTLGHLDFSNLPTNSEILADKIYNSEEIELALKNEGINLRPIPKKNSHKKGGYSSQTFIQIHRKPIETAFSLFSELVPRLRVTSLEGAVIKTHLSVVAFSFYQGFRLGILDY